MYQRLLQAVDERFVEIRSLYASHMQCCAGCDECCHYLFDISPVEAIYLHRALSGLAPDVQAAIRDRARSWLVAVAGRGSAVPGSDTGCTSAISGSDLLLLGMSGLRLSCPLLADGRCLVYGARPVVCRMTGAPAVHPLRKGEFVAPCSKNFQEFDIHQTIETFDLNALAAYKKAIEEEIAPSLSPLERRFLGRRWTIAEVVLFL